MLTERTLIELLENGATVEVKNHRNIYIVLSRAEPPTYPSGHYKLYVTTEDGYENMLLSPLSAALEAMMDKLTELQQHAL